MLQSLDSEGYHHRHHGFTASWTTLLIDAQTKSQETGLLMRALSLERHSSMEGRGGLPMTKFFRQQATLEPSLQWNALHPAIQASTLFSIPLMSVRVLSIGASTFCSTCLEVDTQQRPVLRDMGIIPTQHQPYNRQD